MTTVLMPFTPNTTNNPNLAFGLGVGTGKN